mgnify:FL=1
MATPLAVRGLWKRHPELLIGTLLIVAGNLYSGAKNSNTLSFTMEWGGRYLVILTLVLAFYTAELLTRLQRTRNFVLRSLCAVLFSASFLLQMMAVLTPLERVGYLGFEGREKYGYPAFLQHIHYAPVRLLTDSFVTVSKNSLFTPFREGDENLDVSIRHYSNQEYLRRAPAMNHFDLWWYFGLGIPLLRWPTAATLLLLVSVLGLSAFRLLAWQRHLRKEAPPPSRNRTP